jgi:hypothetical protein
MFDGEGDQVMSTRESNCDQPEECGDSTSFHFTFQESSLRSRSGFDFWFMEFLRFFRGVLHSFGSLWLRLRLRSRDRALLYTIKLKPIYAHPSSNVSFLHEFQRKKRGEETGQPRRSPIEPCSA